MYLIKSLSRDKGSGRYTMYLPLSPYRFLGRKGGRYIHCVSTRLRPLVPREGLYQIHGQSLNTHRGKHRSGGARSGQCLAFKGLSRGGGHPTLADRKNLVSVTLSCLRLSPSHSHDVLWVGDGNIPRRWPSFPCFFWISLPLFLYGSQRHDRNFHFLLRLNQTMCSTFWCDFPAQWMTGVVLPHFWAKYSGPLWVNVYRFCPRSCGKIGQLSPEFSQFLSI